MLLRFHKRLPRYALVLPAFLLAGRGLFGQSSGIGEPIVLDDPTLLRLRVNSIPFARVEILDNRFDTVTFRMRQSGSYPAVKETFSGSTRAAVSRYYEKLLAEIKKKGDKVLLLNITQLRIGNSFAVARRAEGKGPVLWEPVRYTIQFCGQAYVQVGPGRYRKIMNFDYHLHMNGEGWTANKDYLPWLLDRILLAATAPDGKSRPGIKGMPHKIWEWGDRKYFDFVREPRDQALAEIDQPVTQNWANYPILKHVPGESGAYVNFDDFREARLTPGPIKMQFDGHDSVYRIQEGPFAPVKLKVRGIVTRSIWPYVVADSSGLYVNLIRKNQYLRLAPSANTFIFRVPDSLPDMYALLTKNCYGATRGYSAIVPSDNLIVALLGAVFLSIIHDATYHLPPIQNVSQERKKNEEYRNCFIDMASGDIIYN
jgi:hypothetical protein